jgi:hypothetical protein
MGAGEMRAIAALIKRVLVDNEDPARVAREASALAAAFPGVRYCQETNR